MKKLSKKGFTLIELLAVIVIMGILMVVAIPAVSRTIENTRKDTFITTAKNYANQVKTLWAADGLNCKKSAGSTETLPSSAAEPGNYYVMIESGDNDMLLEQGGKSPWKRDVKGYVLINVTYDSTNEKTVNKYYVAYSDGIHGLAPALATTSGTGVDTNSKTSDSLGRGDITMTGMTQAQYAETTITGTGEALAGALKCTIA